MTWLVFGVSCLLVLAGAVSVISGAPIIQIERGWAEVIAGTVALSSGGIVFALAAILMRLESLRDAIATPQTSTWQPLPVPVDDEQTDQAALHPAPEPDPPVSASAEKVAELVASDASLPSVDEEMSERHGLWKRVRRPESQLPLPAEPNSPPDIPAVEDPGIPSPIDPPIPVVALVEPPPASSSAALTPDAGATLVTPEDREDEQTLGWLDRSLFRARPKPIATRDVDPLPQVFTSESTAALASSGLEPSLTVDRPAVVAASDAEDQALPSQSHAAADHHDPEAPADDVTVIGRYQAGVASYIMYSDGTIQVETEGGELHRFSSMEELKAYIASQDNPVA